jgi:integrase
MPNISVYPREGRSAKYYISYDCPKRLRRVHEATPYLVSDPKGEQKAYFLAQEKSAGSEIMMRGAQEERFEAWVLPWLNSTYHKRPRTLQRYVGAWKYLGQYLRNISVDVPRALTYHQAVKFVEWRTQMIKPSGRTVSTNTAVLDLKVLQTIMAEAVRREYATTNPCDKVSIQKDKPRRAHRLTPDELALIEAKLPAWIAEDKERRAWMEPAYIIARYQGCRLRETRLNLKSQVDLRGNRVIFIAKGRHGEPHEFPTALHKKVRPLLERLIAERRSYTLEFPPCPSVMWRKFFDSIGLTNAWFHCLRSTVATELALAGVAISLAMRYMGHAKEEIHRAYQDIKASDLGAVADAIGSDAASAHTNPSA